MVFSVTIPQGPALVLNRVNVPTESDPSRTVDFVYPLESKEVEVSVPVTPSIFYQEDASNMGLGTTVAISKGTKTFHLRPVFHQKLHFEGTFNVSPSSSMVIAPGTTSGSISAEVYDYPNRPINPTYDLWVKMAIKPFTPIRTLPNANAEPIASYLYTSAILQRAVGTESWAWSGNHGLAYFVVWRNKQTGNVYTNRYLQSYWTPANVSQRITTKLKEQGYDAKHLRSPEVVLDILESIMSEWLLTNEIGGRISSDGISKITIGDAPSPEAVKLAISNAVRSVSLSPDLSLLDKFDWRDMAYKAYQNIGYADNNGIAFLKDSLSLRASALSMVQTLKSVASAQGVRKAKNLAKTYLSVHYGWKLQLMDTASYIEELRKNKQLRLIHRCSSTSHLQHDGWKATARYHLYYRAKDSGNPTTDIVNRFLTSVDFLPTLENIWDLVPYSFVVDWFVEVGDALTSAGNLGIIRAYNQVLGQCRSITATRQYDKSSLPLPEWLTFEGNIEQKLYVRACNAQATVPVPSLESLVPASHFNHTIEGAALVVSRLR